MKLFDFVRLLALKVINFVYNDCVKWFLIKLSLFGVKFLNMYAIGNHVCKIN